MSDPVRLGLVGIGVGASQLLRAFTTTPYGRMVAAADVRPEALERLSAEYGVKTCTSVQELCDHVEAVWVATPNQLHARHAIAALERGKHVIVSKPMAISLEEAEQMVSAAERNKVHLLAGHSQCMAPTIRRMAAYTQSGELGRLGMLHTWHFTDWMHRPRLPEELDVAQGGGPVFRQASHQVDIVRSIAGQPLRSVRAMTVQDGGAYTVYLEFADGTPATIVYSGYGHFDLASWLHGGDGSSKAEQPTDKNALRYGAQGARGSNTLGLFGLTLASFERGDVRESADGLEVHHRGHREHVDVPDEPRGSAELEELYEAVRYDKPLKHDGRWGRDTLEVCLAIHQSAQTRQEVFLASM
jgi:phthalate 4,5-cis-dihydrodiol dehydrogenase